MTGVSFAPGDATRIMLAKFFATSLIVLILLPFTAPFSTYEWATQFGHARDHATSFPRRATSRASFDNSIALLPTRVVKGRAKPTALMAPRFVYRAPVSAAGFTSSADSRRRPQRLDARLTILRL